MLSVQRLVSNLLLCGTLVCVGRAQSEQTYRCEVLEKRKCFSTPLGYTHTSTFFAEDSASQAQVEANLEKWKGLKFLSKCWTVLQPFLCQVYKPRCDASFNNLSYPCRQQCLATRKPCSVVKRYHKDWPRFLKCDRFPECAGEVKKVKLSEGPCLPPLVETEHQSSWYEGIEGCGIQCQNPIFTDEEHTRIHNFVAAFGFVSFFCTLFTVVTFLVGWRSQNRYPSLILFYMNSCFCMADLGFLLQFTSSSRPTIVCRKDNTMRLQEPSEDDAHLCITTFLLVYYFSLAGTQWFVILAYSWSICFKNLGNTLDNFVGKTMTFHLTAWSFPAMLALIILFLKEVDGNSLSGICMVGYQHPHMRGAFLLGPLLIALITGGVFLGKGLITLYKLRRSNPEFLGNRSSLKIRETIIRVGVFAFIAFVFMFTTFACYLYEYYNQKLWEESYMKFLRCTADEAVKDDKNQRNPCHADHRPNLSIIELELFSLFGAGIAMSSWTWSSNNTLKTWRKLWDRITRKRRYPMLSHYRLAKIRNKRRHRVGPVAALEAAAVLPYPAIPETQMKAIMKAGTTIQALGTKPPVQEAPLRLQSASEFTPVNQEGKQS